MGGSAKAEPTASNREGPEISWQEGPPIGLRALLLADADLRFAIVRGLRKCEPAVDFLPAQGVIRESLKDHDVLVLAANLERVLVSHDFDTMPGHFYRFLESRESPGIVLIPQLCPLGQAVEELRIAWVCQESEEFKNRIIYLPL